ncbi:TPA: hypothetical protein MNC65_003523 [Klebsiella pneumoniae]|nr:hypothetical protein [Klebsiella pneumoniae]
MNIETVNELIASLENAGELSIKETKVMVLAKAYQQLAAENVELKSSRAILAENALESCNSIACAGFRHEAIMRGLYASTGNGNKYPKPITTLVDEAMRKLETPATDRIVAGIKADGVESGIKTIMVMLNHQAPGVSDAINVLRIYCSKLREVAKHD